MLRFRGHYCALRHLSGFFDASAHRRWQRASLNAAPSAGNKATSRDRSSSSSGSGSSSSNRKRSGGCKSSIVAAARAGPQSEQLREWQQAMLRLADRYKVEANPEKPDKISEATASYVPDALETWKLVIEGGGNLWFRGAAKFYASVLAGVWPKIANYFLLDLIGACNHGASPRQAESGRSAVSATSASVEGAAAAAAGAADTFGMLDWKRGLEVVREAKVAGVQLTPELLELLLSKVPPGNSRKVSRLVSSEASAVYGFPASPAMLAMAAVTHWREGVVSGAARHLDEMEKIPASYSPFVEEWLASETQNVYAASIPPRGAAETGAAAEAAGAAGLNRSPRFSRRQWPWRLVVVDIYGRAGRWSEVTDAFDAFLVESTNIRSLSGRPRLQKVPGRLPLPEEPDGDAAVVTASETAAAAAAEPWASVHPAPLAHVVMAYLKPGKVDAAARALFFLKTSLNSAEVMDTSFTGGAREDSVCTHGETVNRDLPLGVPDPAWLDAAVRGFARLGRWDLAGIVLSPEICEWAAAHETVAAGQQAHQGGGGRGGGGDRKGFGKTRESLRSFLESKVEVKRPARGQVAGARACLEALERIFEPGDAEKAGGVGNSSGLWPTTVAPPVPPVERQQPEESLVEVALSSSASSRLSNRESKTERREPGSSDDDDINNARERGEKEQQQLVYSEAIRWLSLVELEKRDRAAAAAPPAAFPIASETSRENTPGSPLDELSSPSCGENRSDAVGDALSLARQLRYRSAALPQEAMLDAVRRAWVPPESADRGGSDETKERRRSAAFALYEAGVESGTLAEGAHWASPTAGVMDLYCRDYRENRAVPLAALNFVLTDMLRRHAYGEEVRRHVHHPHADLVMIAGIVASEPVLNTVRGVLWLLGSCFGDALGGGAELLGRALDRPGTPPTQQSTTPQPQLLVDAAQIGGSPRRGVVLSLPRHTLQRWLLTEGRARRRGEGGDTGWSPSWLEDGIDVLPPVLPGRADDRHRLFSARAGSAGEMEGGDDTTASRRRGISVSFSQEV